MSGFTQVQDMNRFERGFQPGQEAKLRYQQGDFTVLVPGSFVRCAVTGEPIPIDDLKYWSEERQEPYASAEVALERYLETDGKR